MAFDGAFFSFSELSKNQNDQNHGEHAAQDFVGSDVVEN